MAIIHKYVKKNEKIIIFSQWVSMLNIVKDTLAIYFKDLKYITIQGSIPLNERNVSISEFQTNPDIKLCLISLTCSSEGINLTSSNNVIFLDLYWNDATMRQAEDRTYRIGQTKNVNVYKLIIENSIELQLEELIQHKKKISNLIMNKWTKKNDNETFFKNVIKLIEKNK